MRPGVCSRRRGARLAATARWLDQALGTQLRTKFKPRIEDYKIYRIYPGGDTEFLHPKDGVFSEKVNEGRPMVGHNPRRIGQNVNPANIKFSGRNTFDA